MAGADMLDDQIVNKDADATKADKATVEAFKCETRRRPSPAQREYLMRGLAEPGGKLPLFDLNGQRISRQTIRSCMEHGWCEPWTHNPILPSWLVCKLTNKGRTAIAKSRD